MFKIGQKVVCISTDWLYKDSPLFDPKLNEIVTIEKYSTQNPKNVHIVEYPRALCGRLQHFGAHRFRPIDYSFGKNLSKEIEQDIEREIMEPLIKEALEELANA